MQRSGFIWAELLPRAVAKGKKKKKEERIKGYDCRKCHPKPDKRESTGGWRHYLNEPSSWAIARKRKGEKKVEHYMGSDPKLCSVPRTGGMCVFARQYLTGDRPVRWGHLMSASHSCPAEKAQPAQRPNTDVSLQPQWIVVTCHELFPHGGENWNPDGSPVEHKRTRLLLSDRAADGCKRWIFMSWWEDTEKYWIYSIAGRAKSVTVCEIEWNLWENLY